MPDCFDPELEGKALRQRLCGGAHPDDLRLFQHNIQHQWYEMDVLVSVELDLALIGELLKPMELRLDRLDDLSPQRTTFRREQRTQQQMLSLIQLDSQIAGYLLMRTLSCLQNAAVL